MKKILSLLLALSFLPFSLVLAATTLTKEQQALGYDQYSTGQYSYNSNVANLCLGQRYGGDAWNFDTSKQLITEHNKNKYPDLAQTGWSVGFDGIRKIYQDTQNNIMNCAILKSKYTLHEKIIKDYKVSDRAKKVLQDANKAIEQQIQQQKCIAPRDGDKIYNYKDLLDSMSYEQCVYNMYLFYYQKVCDNNIGACAAGKNPQTATEWAEVIKTEKNKITDEFDLSRRSMDTALSLYENFEKTYVAHILLNLIEIELTEDKRYIGVMLKAMEQWVSLAKNAEKNTSDR